MARNSRNSPRPHSTSRARGNDFRSRSGGAPRPGRRTSGPSESREGSDFRRGKNQGNRNFRKQDQDGPGGPGAQRKASFGRPGPYSGERKSGEAGGRNERSGDFRKGRKDWNRNEQDRSYRKKADNEDRPLKKSWSAREGGQRTEKSGKEERKFNPRGKKPFRSGSGRTYPPRKKEFSGDQKPANQTEDVIRLNRFISNSGVCSRRDADELIKAGVITVNGKAVTELGYKVNITDDIRYEGKRLRAQKPVYILLNKPKGYITTTDDPQERNTVMQLIQGACKERVYPVGRLDRNTSGLLLLTNDGELTDKLTHPSYNVKKIYKVELDRPLTKNDFQKIRDGVYLEEGKAQVDDLALVTPDGKTVGVELHIGWNRIVRRIFEALGYEVVKLDRSVYATLDKKDLGRGHWRFLREDEIIRLKHLL